MWDFAVSLQAEKHNILNNSCTLHISEARKKKSFLSQGRNCKIMMRWADFVIWLVQNSRKNANVTTDKDNFDDNFDNNYF